MEEYYRLTTDKSWTGLEQLGEIFTSVSVIIHPLDKLEISRAQAEAVWSTFCRDKEIYIGKYI